MTIIVAQAAAGEQHGHSELHLGAAVGDQPRAEAGEGRVLLLHTGL